MKFRIEVGTSVGALEDSVNTKLGEGWELYGHTFTTPSIYPGEPIFIYQPMILPPLYRGFTKGPR